MCFTFLVLRQAEVTVPAGDQDHVVTQVLLLNLELLHDNDVGLKNVEHSAERAALAPWLVAKRIADTVHVPGSDADHGGRCAGKV